MNNYSAYQRWVKTTHERAKFAEVMLSMTDMLFGSHGCRKHKDLRPAEVKKIEQQVKRTVDAIKSFLNPFDIPDESKLYCLSSGAPVYVDIERDILRADQLGKERKEQFIRERLEQKDHFFDPIKKSKLKTMGNSGKAVRVKTSKNKVQTAKYRQQGNVMLQLLVRSQEGAAFDIEALMSSL